MKNLLADLIITPGGMAILSAESIRAMPATVVTTVTSLEQVFGSKHHKPITIVIEIVLIKGRVLIGFFIFCRQAY